MYRDNTLLPKEAIRLAVLGILAARPMGYAELASEVRHFISRVAGPSVDLMGSSIELLRLEGLIEADSEDKDTASLTLTEDGRAELVALLESGVRAPFTGVNKLVIGLKLRFFHLLDPDEQRNQADMMIEACQTELARMIDLRKRHEGEPGQLAGWLDQDITELQSRLVWFEKFREGL